MTSHVSDCLALTSRQRTRRRAYAPLQEVRRRERAAAARMRRVQQVREQLITAANHELRTPLSSVLGYTELLLEGDAGPLNPEQREMVACVERNGARLRDLVLDLVGTTAADLRD